MTVAVGFPGFDRAARIHRMPVNPLDKSTIVSLLPKVVDEVKPTIFPGRFIIEAAPRDNPDDFATLVVGPSSWFKEMEEGQPFLEIPVSSINLADSIIRDYCNGLVACNMGDTMPGLFYVPGAQSKADIRKNCAQQLKDFREKQFRWMTAVIKIADVMWARTQGNPLSISDDARLFAEMLGGKYKTRPWLGEIQAIELSPCPACGEMINLRFPVCKHCHVVHDKKKAEEMGIVFAKG